MKPEMKFVGNGYELTTHLGDKIKLNWYDMQEVARFLRHSSWEDILENWVDDEEIPDDQRAAFIAACIDEAEDRYQNGDDVDIYEVCAYVMEDWGTN